MHIGIYRRIQGRVYVCYYTPPPSLQPYAKRIESSCLHHRVCEPNNGSNHHSQDIPKNAVPRLRGFFSGGRGGDRSPDRHTWSPSRPQGHTIILYTSAPDIGFHTWPTGDTDQYSEFHIQLCSCSHICLSQFYREKLIYEIVFDPI